MNGLGPGIGQRDVDALVMHIAEDLRIQGLAAFLVGLGHQAGDGRVQPVLAFQAQLGLIVPVRRDAPRGKIGLRIVGRAPGQGVLQFEVAALLAIQKGAKFCVTDKPDVLKYVRSKYKNSVIMIFASSEDAFSGLYKEQCATFIDSKSSMYYYISKHRLRQLTVKDIPFTGEVTYKIAVGDNKAELLNKINKGLDYLMSTREIDEISKKWFSIPSDL